MDRIKAEGKGQCFSLGATCCGTPRALKGLPRGMGAVCHKLWWQMRPSAKPRLQVSGQADVGYPAPCSPHRRGCLPEGILRPHLEQSKRPRGAEPPEPFQRE